MHNRQHVELKGHWTNIESRLLLAAAASAEGLSPTQTRHTAFSLAGIDESY